MSSFYTRVLKIRSICYTVTEIWCVTDIIFIFHFGLAFALLRPKDPKNDFFFFKMNKMPRNIIILHMRNKKYDHMMYSS